jgi:hypothetical protein
VNISPLGAKFTPRGEVKNGHQGDIVYFGQHFSPTFSTVRGCIYFDNNVLGYILGDFFTKSSGHPDQEGSFFIGGLGRNFAPTLQALGIFI